MSFFSWPALLFSTCNSTVSEERNYSIPLYIESMCCSLEKLSEWRSLYLYLKYFQSAANSMRQESLFHVCCFTIFSSFFPCCSFQAWSKKSENHRHFTFCWKHLTIWSFCHWKRRNTVATDAQFLVSIKIRWYPTVLGQMVIFFNNFPNPVQVYS